MFKIIKRPRIEGVPEMLLQKLVGLEFINYPIPRCLLVVGSGTIQQDMQFIGLNNYFLVATTELFRVIDENKISGLGLHLAHRVDDVVAFHKTYCEDTSHIPRD